MKLFLLGLFGAFTLLFLFMNFGRNLQPTSASPASTAPPTVGAFPTVDAVSREVYYDLNMAIEDMERSTKFNMLEHISGASYQVVYVGLQPNNGSPTTMQVYVRCECASNADCCSSLHTFVITMQAMDDVFYEPLILTAVPPSVTNLSVSTFDHTGSQNGMTVPWSDVVKFLQSDLEGHGLDGFRLWYEVTPQP